jgi:hypothetical protein
VVPVILLVDLRHSSGGLRIQCISKRPGIIQSHDLKTYASCRMKLHSAALLK